MVDPKLKRPMVGDTDEGTPLKLKAEKGPKLSRAEPTLSPSFHPNRKGGFNVCITLRFWTLIRVVETH